MVVVPLVLVVVVVAVVVVVVVVAMLAKGAATTHTGRESPLHEQQQGRGPGPHHQLQARWSLWAVAVAPRGTVVVAQ
jgi:hypothetical protein